MFGYGSCEFCPCSFKQFRPFICIKMFTRKHRNKFFVAKLGEGAVSLFMMLTRNMPFKIHVS